MINAAFCAPFLSRKCPQSSYPVFPPIVLIRAYGAPKCCLHMDIRRLQ